ncbi:SDR family NAD(P)-dependent oxidoreductase [Ruegeria faecimaris]|uniref:NAD(P)-dependent dehydrogenase, short-chain alcohol dehydrogenase family n=1 Tax=Ruegeria faecimaris TaxID=686389 RepID=A0A521CCI8_9RHOB|nr:SDR family oxidoreductase [Ruegeria faecimaris]SMO56511.1 NAD(P)-dependent dehydrogenase, short-chain alcohol dehydrogenase family [Ruegeria faecimaris]
MSANFANYPGLAGKTVFITGGAGGIGAETVRAFAAQGARVGFVDLNADAGQALLAELDGQHAFAQCDLRDIEALQAAFERLVAALGEADVLVNNAAHDERHDWREVTPEYWDDRMATNIRHMFFAIQSVAPGMIAKGKGAIVNLGSNSWWECGAGFPAYATAKSAVHGLTRTMARELGDHRIRVNTVVPGWIMTERQKELWVTPEALAKQVDRQCLPDPIEPVYVARMVLFLASDDAAMCSAGNFMVEGGSI